MRSLFIAVAEIALVTCGLAGGIATPAQAQSIGLNFEASLFAPDRETSTYSKYIPPDTDGAVGPNHIVELINDHYSIFRKSDGVRLNPVTDRDVEFWNQAGIPIVDPPGLTDPRIVFDKSSQRWFAAEITYPFLGPAIIPNDVLIAVSKTSDPTQGWRGYRIAGTDPGTNPDPSAGPAGPTGFIVDYPVLGVNAQGVYVTTNNFKFDLGIGDFAFDSMSMFVINKPDLTSGKTPHVGRFSGLDANVYGVSAHPVIETGTSAGEELLLSVPLNSPANQLILTTLTVHGPTSTHFVPVPAFSVQVSGGLQPDGTETLETLDPRFGSSVYKVNNDIWAVHSIDALYGTTNPTHRTALRWYRIDANTGTLADMGTLSDANHDYIMPSIAANDAGSVVLGFTRTGLHEFPSAYAAVGHTAQGKTTFNSPILLKAGADLYHFIPGLPQNDRWGDYSATIVDPNNPQTFWTFQEWAAPSFASSPLFGVFVGRWATQVAQITVPTHGGGPAAASADDPQVALLDDDATAATLSAADAAPGKTLNPRPKVTSRLH
jgi:hypothetical protein